MSARTWLLRLLLAAVFVSLRLKFNREYEGAPWEVLVAGTAKLPFGHRVLVPWLVRPFIHAGVSIRAAFATTEWLAAVAALTGMESALRRFIDERFARVGAFAFVAVLALLFLLPFRWPLFYPWDTPAIACVIWGVALAHGRRHGVLVVLAVVGAANRESAVLLPFITLTLLAGSEHRREAIRSASLQLAGVVLVRLAISVLIPTTKGGAVDLRIAGMWRIDHNLQWFADPLHALPILGAFSMLPVLWFVVRADIPAVLRRLEWVVIPVMAGLMVVANLYEPRAWGEPVALLFVGVVVGVARWVQGAEPVRAPDSGCERWTSAALLLGAVVAMLLWRVL
ncbi:MAG: hypothetical protein ACRBN8_29155 [Nannocystales bacterium]